MTSSLQYFLEFLGINSFIYGQTNDDIQLNFTDIFTLQYLIGKIDDTDENEYYSFLNATRESLLTHYDAYYHKSLNTSHKVILEFLIAQKNTLLDVLGQFDGILAGDIFGSKLNKKDAEELHRTWDDIKKNSLKGISLIDSQINTIYGIEQDLFIFYDELCQLNPVLPTRRYLNTLEI